jgi:hypothetical protein
LSLPDAPVLELRQRAALQDSARPALPRRPTGRGNQALYRPEGIGEITDVPTLEEPWVADADVGQVTFTVPDFDLVMRDPANPTRMLPACDSGDHLYPNDTDYQAMACSVDQQLFTRGAAHRARPAG